MKLNVRVITPDRIFLDTTVDQLILPSSTGQLGILEGHAPLLTALDIGVLRLQSAGKWTALVLMNGFAEVSNSGVTILCVGAEEASSIDPAKAKEELEEALIVADKAETKKQKIDSAMQLRTARARLNALS